MQSNTIAPPEAAVHVEHPERLRQAINEMDGITIRLEELILRVTQTERNPEKQPKQPVPDSLIGLLELGPQMMQEKHNEQHQLIETLQALLFG